MRLRGESSIQMQRRTKKGTCVGEIALSHHAHFSHVEATRFRSHQASRSDKPLGELGRPVGKSHCMHKPVAIECVVRLVIKVKLGVRPDAEKLAVQPPWDLPVQDLDRPEEPFRLGGPEIAHQVGVVRCWCVRSGGRCREVALQGLHTTRRHG